MKAVHFGAGNIERGFIDENLNKNQFEITFVDANAPLIKTLSQEKKWSIHYAAEGQKEFFAEVKKYLAPEEHEYRKQ